jgi:hypothetical protein
MSGKILKPNWVMDYETICNCFIAVFVHYKDDTIKKTFVVHEFLQDDFLAFVAFLKLNRTNKEWHISYNGLAFDSQISQYILDNCDTLSAMSSSDRVKHIYAYAQKTIETSNNGGFSQYAPYKLYIKQLDLFKMNHWDNKAKMSSLKWIQYSMDWKNVEEMPHPHDQPILTKETLDKVIMYCENDVLSTKEIYNLSKEQIGLRQGLSKTYGIDLYSASEPRISKEIFVHFLHEALGKSKYEIKQLRTPRTHIVLADCILPYIHFQTPEFQKILDQFRTKVITSTKDGFKFTLNYKGVKTDYGLGGIHGSAEPGVYKPPPGWVIITSDVKSFYPNLAIRNKFHPAHLPQDVFCDLYEWFYDERIKIPKIDPRNYVYKIILNSTYGLTGDENSFLYDPRMTMQITVNGQLSLSMLYEQLAIGIPEAIPLMQNTDGLEMMIPEASVQDYMRICENWERLTKLELEHDEYKKMIIRDVNNYIAVTKKDKVKCKGAFEWEDLQSKKVASLHKNKSFLIIPKAIYAYFVNGILPEDFLADNKDVLDYCAGVKSKGEWKLNIVQVVQQVPEKFREYTDKQKKDYLKAHGWNTLWSEDNWVHTSWYNNPKVNIDWAGVPLQLAFNQAVKSEAVVQNTTLQKIVRYFISNNGGKITKKHPDGREIQVEAGQWMQTVMNKIDSTIPLDEYDINFKYYLEEIWKQIEGIEKVRLNTFKQLTLF